ncbi:MAG: hypothetical protein ABSF27_02540 [Candidatus Dormibacteria bacterium]
MSEEPEGGRPYHPRDSLTDPICAKAVLALVEIVPQHGAADRVEAHAAGLEVAV